MQCAYGGMDVFLCRDSARECRMEKLDIPVFDGEIETGVSEMKNLKVRAGKTYDAYFDGKHSQERMVTVEVDYVGSRGDLTRREQRMWRKAILEDLRNVFDGCISYLNEGKFSEQFWDWNCDSFIEGHIVGDPRTKKDRMLFARDSSGGWYGVNWNYQLDVTGKVRRELRERLKKAAEDAAVEKEVECSN